ncbi:hypothetical protein ACFQ2B_06975 [Streptomyces stramineus]
MPTARASSTPPTSAASGAPTGPTGRSSSTALSVACGAWTGSGPEARRGPRWSSSRSGGSRAGRAAVEDEAAGVLAMAAPDARHEVRYGEVA